MLCFLTIVINVESWRQMDLIKDSKQDPDFTKCYQNTGNNTGITYLGTPDNLAF